MVKNFYNYQGEKISIGGNYDLIVKAIAHRGYSTTAPENTLPAYKLAKAMGFYYVETDVSFTSDGVAVCLHDATIDRTSNGTGNINSLTWEQVQSYDFGSWKSPDYAGTKIPSFEQFILLCRNLGLHPYIELKNSATYTETQIRSLVDIVKSHGMEGKVTWISFASTYLTYVKNYDPKARLGFVVFNLTSANITTAQGLLTGTNDVFVDVRWSTLTSEMVDYAKTGNVPLEVWIIENASEIEGMNPYITGVTSNSLIAGKILYEKNI